MASGSKCWCCRTRLPGNSCRPTTPGAYARRQAPRWRTSHLPCCPRPGNPSPVGIASWKCSNLCVSSTRRTFQERIPPTIQHPTCHSLFHSSVLALLFHPALPQHLCHTLASARTQAPLHLRRDCNRLCRNNVEIHWPIRIQGPLDAGSQFATPLSLVPTFWTFGPQPAPAHASLSTTLVSTVEVTHQGPVLVKGFPALAETKTFNPYL